MKSDEHLLTVLDIDLITSNLPTGRSHFAEMVEAAVKSIRGGDQRFAPVDKIVFGKLNALADLEQLDPEKWQIIRVDGGVLIISSDFLQIQDDFPQIDETANDWSKERALNGLIQYLDVYSSKRQSHMLLLEQVLTVLEDRNNHKLADNIRETWARERGCSTFEEARQNYLSARRLVALPWVDDSPYVWQEILKIPKELTDRYSSVKKINELGIIFASRQFRGIGVPSHDYFSYAADLAKRRGLSIEDILLSTASHEGSHGPIESMAVLTAGIPELSFISEGFPSVFGNDQRENDSLDSTIGMITLDRLVNQEAEENDAIKKTLIYAGGARFFRALFNILSKAGDSEPWTNIVVNMFESAQQTSTLQDRDETQRLSFFTDVLLNKLALTKEDVDKELQKYL